MASRSALLLLVQAGELFARLHCLCTETFVFILQSSPSVLNLELLELFFLGQIFNIGLFLVKFPDWDWYSYVLLQTIHIVHNSYYVIGFQHLIDTCSLFVVISIAYYTKKFAFIGRQLRRLNVSGRKRTDNRRLANLINDFTTVHVELLKMRKFFSGLIGCHVVGYFGLAALVSTARRPLENATASLCGH